MNERARVGAWLACAVMLLAAATGARAGSDGGTPGGIPGTAVPGLWGAGALGAVGPAPTNPAAPAVPPAAGTAPAAGGGAAELTPKELFAKASPAVVKLSVFCEEEMAVASGSGFFVTTTGQIVTNFHVIQFARTTDNIRVIVGKQTRRVRGVLNMLPKLDLALLAMEMGPGETVPCLAVARQAPAQGEKAYAIGHPLGLENATISDGLVNGLQKVQDTTLLQTSAPISPGSSGGPLLVPDGTVVGVNVASITKGQNLNFAVPAEHVLELIRGAGPLRTAVPAAGRPAAAHLGVPKTGKPINLGAAVDLRDKAVPMTLRRLYAGFIQPYVGMGLARADVGEAERTATFQKYVQWMCQQDLPGRRVVCEAEVVSLAPAQGRAKVFQYLRGMVPKNNPPGRADEYVRQLNDEAAYSFMAVCKSPEWPGTFTAYLHRELGRELEGGGGGAAAAGGAGGQGKAVQISGFLSQWVAVPPTAGRDMQLIISLDACVRTGGKLATAEDEAQRYLNVADTYLKARMPEKAVKALQTILDRYPKTTAAQQAAKMMKDIEKQGAGAGAGTGADGNGDTGTRGRGDAGK
jgi:S1-C subfamily serine protease